MSGRHQQGYIWKKGRAWYGRWYEDRIVDNRVKRIARARKLADYNDRYRNEKDVPPILDAILRPINDNRSNPTGTLTVAQYYEKFFLPHIKAECKPSTAVAYNSIWKPYLSPRLRSAVLRDFRCVDATNLLADIHADRGVGRKTLRNCKGLLSSIFSYAKQTGIIDGQNPIIDAGIPRKASKPKPTHATSADELMAILDTLDGLGRTALALIFFCGLRPGEARGALWQDYDGRRLHIRQSVWRTHIDTPKTDESVACVPVCEPLRSILDEQRQPSGFILAGPSGKPVNLANLARRVVVPALQKKKVPWYGWYSLRRGIATLATAVESPLAAKGLLRHTNVGTTQQFYIKDVPEETQRAMEKIEDLFSRKGTAK
jgi:integrase